MTRKRCRSSRGKGKTKRGRHRGCNEIRNIKPDNGPAGNHRKNRKVLATEKEHGVKNIPPSTARGNAATYPQVRGQDTFNNRSLVRCGGRVERSSSEPGIISEQIGEMVFHRTRERN